MKGNLYIVATPIGNLRDITARAVEVLSSVTRIAAEDTRHSQRLLKHLGLTKPLVALHEYNEREKASVLLEPLHTGETLALISDAGTPLISDPGYALVRLAHQQKIQVVPIPGPCAAIVALSASGLPSDRFVFEGFLPAKSNARCQRLENLVLETRTLIFFEAPHRILETLLDLQAIFGEQREAVLARELSKTFETIRLDTLSGLYAWVQADPQQQRGEIVLLVAGRLEKTESKLLNPEAEKILKILLEELSVKQASALAAKITGLSKRLLYERALQLS
jgi:16S rRNA (cytidine1402-2'-O)-methyltransferase